MTMAAISESTRHFVDGKLAEAAVQIEAGRRQLPPAPLDFDRALRIIAECRAAIGATADIDDIATHLRATERALEHCCPGATKGCVSSALQLIDRAIQGETF
jgi:hypothetical protein